MTVHRARVRIVVIELVGGEHLSHVGPHPQAFRGGNGVPEQGPGSGSAELTREPVLVRKMGIGGRAHSDDHIPHADILADSPSGADANNGFHTVELVQLIGIQPDGRHAHTVAHNGNLLALVVSRIAQHIPDGVEADGIFQVMLRNVFGPQGVAGH